MEAIKNLLFLLPILKFTVQEESMLPTLKPGDNVLVWRFGRTKPGDIVVANILNPEGLSAMGLVIKRVEKIEGDQYFLVGDNPEKSTDSRQFGWVPRSQIIGTVFNKIQ